MRNVFHHFDDALATTTLTGKQPSLPSRDAVQD